MTNISKETHDEIDSDENDMDINNDFEEQIIQNILSNTSDLTDNQSIDSESVSADSNSGNNSDDSINDSTDSSDDGNSNWVFK